MVVYFHERDDETKMVSFRSKVVIAKNVHLNERQYKKLKKLLKSPCLSFDTFLKKVYCVCFMRGEQPIAYYFNPFFNVNF